eukprot:TRINITY_DN9033_c0_g1_i1.p1 TRINITY_DN9033_c0_g1~~TRINITY_DN9033_c0_g1_i1.p1  ORF type:complete len:108 (-),score=23.83 TRINITY_DN9033_c0_g1_i1:102-425(-)
MDCTRASKLVKKLQKMLDSANATIETLEKKDTQMQLSITALRNKNEALKRQSTTVEKVVKTQTWMRGQEPAVMPKALNGASSVKRQGKIYIAGGYDDNNICSESVLE